jgi:hypothetical protein
MPSSRVTEFHADLGDDQIELRGPAFGVEFRRLGDRWSHAILGQGAGIALARTISVQPEGEDPARVVAPVYQEAQLHGPENGASLCLLLTGLFFKHHFSAAVTLARDPLDDGRIRLEFDVADRCRSPVETLAATYLVGLDSGALTAADPDRIAWRLDSGLLELLAFPPASLAMAEAGRRATRVQVLAAIQPGSFTHRLHYGWRWTSDDGFTRKTA